MKQVLSVLLLALLVLGLYGCGKQETVAISITIPASCTEDFVYAQEEIQGTRKSLSQKLGLTNDIGAPVAADCQVPPDIGILFKEASGNGDTVYASFDTKEIPLVQDRWYRVGVTGKNSTDQDLVVTMTFQDAQVRIAEGNAVQK